MNFSHVSGARRAAKSLSTELGFDDQAREEIVIVASELAANLVKHAQGGLLTLNPLHQDGKVGIEIESKDSGPGFTKLEDEITDGVSSSDGLGAGLGAVNRLMDEFHISPRDDSRRGTLIVCRRWVRDTISPARPSRYYDFGVATRAYPGMRENGDAFVIKTSADFALVGVIDGVGHGQFAHHASRKAREYIEAHFDQPLESIFRGVERSCRGTRGVVMALARFAIQASTVAMASVGNIESRVIGGSTSRQFAVRRGILGVNAPKPKITESRWEPGRIMILSSDGLLSHWDWNDFLHLENKPANTIARELLRVLAKDDDDATVLVIRDPIS